MWSYKNCSLDEEDLLIQESLFSLANGYIGIRGNFEEGYSKENTSIRGTYINGFYETIEINYGEKLYGFPSTKEKLPNVMDAQGIKIFLDDEEVSLFNLQHTNYDRQLHFDKGCSTRNSIYVTKSGKKASIQIKRLVSMLEKELALIDVQVKYQGRIHIISTIDGNISNYSDKDDPRLSDESDKLLQLEEMKANLQTLTMKMSTVNQEKEIVCHVTHEVTGDYEESFNSDKESQVLTTELVAYNQLHCTKYIVYTDSYHHKKPLSEGNAILLSCLKKGCSYYVNGQETFYKDYWKTSDIIVEGNDSIQESIRFGLFQLIQSVGVQDVTNVPAKGLSGEGYEGHYFWDTEIYVFPVIQLTHPEIGRELLKHRYHMLDHARNRAIELGHNKGAAYPWRTISGKECSAYFPAGTAQYHINGDIAYSFIQSYLYNKDLEFVIKYGAEVLFETARIWIQLGHYNKGQFEIHEVTGPDEYSCLVNNNYYTNVLAKYNLLWAVKFYRILEQIYPNELRAIMAKISLTDIEIQEFSQASEKMYLPFDEERLINKQDDAFMEKKEWDFEGTPSDKYPLLLHYHPLTIYRYQVIKQADTVLAQFLLEEYSDISTIRKSYDYYESRTTHDSSLSACIYGIMASKCGYYSKAYDYFMESVRLDLDNTHKNTKDGLHIANLSGNILSVIYGFAGYRIKEDGIAFSPWCPSDWDSYAFHIKYNHSVLEVKVDQRIQVTLIDGSPVKIRVYDTYYDVKDTLTVALKGGSNLD